MDLNFYSDLTDGTGQHDGDPEFLDPHSFNGFDSDNKFSGGSDNYLSISGSSHSFLSSSETFHTPSLGDEEFEIPPISLDPDSALTVSDVVSHFGELSDGGPSGGVVVPGNAVEEGDDPSFASTFVGASSQGLDHLSLGVMGQSGASPLLASSLGMDLGHPMSSQFSSSPPVTIDVPLGDMSQGLLGSNQLTTIDQSELSAQLGLGLGSGNLLQQPQSPDNPLSGPASPSSSMQVDDMEDFRRSVLVDSPLPMVVSPGIISLDPSLSERDDPKDPKDPNEPQKPVSAYALFFRDTQAAIKGQNPNASFGEVSKIVASMWDSLGEEQKQVYKRKNEAAKKDYLKARAEYRSHNISQPSIEVMDTSPSHPPASAGPAPSHPARSTRNKNYNPEENTITNICTSNIIVDRPHVTLRSHMGTIKPPPQTATPNPPTVAKIIIRRTPPASARQMPPLQQMQSTPPPPRLQQMKHTQAPPPLQAKPRGAPPPLQIKVVPSTRQSDAAASIMVKSSVEASVAPSAVTLEVRRAGEEVAESEDGMQVEVNVAPAPSVTPTAGPSVCVRAGCTNAAVESSDWDREYCSNECVATHCRDVFMAWCAIRGQNSTSVT